MTFHINEKKFDTYKFLRVLHKILSFNIPSLGIRDIFVLPSKNVEKLVKNIGILRDHLYYIPGTRFYNEVPEVMKKIHIERTVKITV